MSKNAATSGKGVSWGSLTGQPAEGYRQSSSGESHSGSPSSKFIGPTKGNKDLPCDRSAGVKEGPRHVAGGSNAGKSGY